MNLVLSATRAVVNDMVDATALVSGTNGTPTGRVDFSAERRPAGLGDAGLARGSGTGRGPDVSRRTSSARGQA